MASKKVPDVVSTFSFSKLETYDKCSQLFKLIYQDKIYEVRADSIHTRLGSVCHSALEDFYGDETGTIATAYDALLRENGVWDRELVKYGLQVLKPELFRYANHVVKLYKRGHPSYTGADAIRTREGQVAKDLTRTAAWRDYAKSFGLDNMAARIDKTAGDLNKDWKELSLSEVFAQTVGIMSNYVHPTMIDSVVAIELPISYAGYAAADKDGKLIEGVVTSMARGEHPLWLGKDGKPKLVDIENPFFFPESDESGKLIENKGDLKFSKETMFNGFIDLVARDPQGRLILIDHKTSSEAPTIDKVARHEQLLAYGLAVYFMTGEMPYKIGINHLRSSKLIMAPFDLAKAKAVFERWNQIKKAIDAKAFIKQNPDGFTSQCIKTMRGQLSLCPGLKFCHPDIYDLYNPTATLESF